MSWCLSNHDSVLFLCQAMTHQELVFLDRKKETGRRESGQESLFDWAGIRRLHHQKLINGTARFKKCKNLYKYQHLLLHSHLVVKVLFCI